ncbi:MAG: acylphosphatase [Pedobacter sp.]|nr:MAG: acylphosphatase [Pedobacter sp.]
MEKLNYQIKVTGKVQGVFYRASTKAVADQLGIKGTVKNMPDGSVEIVAEGSSILLAMFLDWCAEGPEKAQVEKVDHREGEVQNFINFEVIKKH